MLCAVAWGALRGVPVEVVLDVLERVRGEDEEEPQVAGPGVARAPWTMSDGMWTAEPDRTATSASPRATTPLPSTT